MDNTSLFLGREEVLRQIHEAFQTDHLVVISAPPGMGKTIVAQEYARRYAHMYGQVVQVNMASAATLIADVLKLADRLALPLDEQNIVGINKVLQNWLTLHPNTLLILDNVGDLTPVTSPEAPSAFTLLLTRKARTDSQLTQIHLERLSDEEGALLLLRSGQLADSATLEGIEAGARSLALTLAQEMDGLPLALELAGAFLRTSGESLPWFLAAYRDAAAHQFQRGEAQTGASSASAIIGHLCAHHLEQKRPAALDLLQRCALLPEGTTPSALLRQGTSELPPALQELAQNPELLQEALILLHSLGLFPMREESASLSMQPATREIIYQMLSSEKREELIVRALLALSHLLPTHEQAPPTTRLHLAMQVSQLAQLSSTWTFPDTVADALDWAASVCWEWMLIADAELLLRNALKIWERFLGTGNERVHMAIRKLGTLNAFLKRFEEAENLLQRAMLLYARRLGATHPDVLLCLLDLAAVYAEQGKSRETQACYLEVLKIGEPALGQNHPLLVMAAHELAQIAAAKKNFAEAEAYYQRVLPVYEEMLGMADGRTQECFEQMIEVLLEQEKYAEGEALLQRLLPVYKEAPGIADSKTQEYIEILANVQLAQKKLAPAEALLQELLIVKEQILGTAHAETRMILQKIGEVALMQEHLTRAEEIYQRLCALCEVTSGQERDEMRQYLSMLASLYLLQGKSTEAGQTYQRLAREW